MLRACCASLLAGAVVLAACGDEDPVGVGGELLPGGVIRTFEVVLDAREFLAEDTAVAGFERPATASFMLVAEAYAGTLDAHALARFLVPALVYRDAAGTAQLDSLPNLRSGSVLARVDTTQGRSARPVELRLYAVPGEWDARTADWRLRVDSAGVRRAWDAPGGDRGTLLGTAVLAPGADSAVFAIDSARLAHFSDTTSAGRGVLVTSATPDVRLSLRSLLLRAEGRPRQRADTVVSGVFATAASTFLFEPRAEPTRGLRVGGIPASRSYLRLRDGLADLRLKCALAEGGRSLRCAAGADTTSIAGPAVRLRVGDARITHAALLLQPVAVPRAFQPADTVLVQVREVLRAPLVPLARAPIGALATPRTAPLVAVSPSIFDGAGAPVEASITEFVDRLIRGPEDDEPAPSSILALIATPESGSFGFAGFGSLAAGAAPRLRLVLTLSGTEALR